MTYEKVLSVFGDYLKQEDAYEVVKAKAGYTVLGLDRVRKDWNIARLCHTPDILMEELLYAFENHFEYCATHGERPLTQEERQQMETQVQSYRERCSE